MSRLAFADPPPLGGRPVNFLLFGGPGTGKTLGAASAPGPILYLNADVGGALDLAYAHYGREKIREVRVTNLQTLSDVVIALNEEPQAFATVALDPGADVYRSIIEGLNDRAISPSLPEYQATGVHLERFCRNMCENPNFNFVMCFHEYKVKDEEQGTVETYPFTGTDSVKLGNKLRGMADVVGWTTLFHDEKTGDKNWVAQLIPEKGRQCKDRFNVLGDFRTVDLQEWIDVIHAAKEEEEKKAEKKDTVGSTRRRKVAA